MPRETSVKISAVSASPKPSVSSIDLRASSPKVDKALETASRGRCRWQCPTDTHPAGIALLPSAPCPPRCAQLHNAFGDQIDIRFHCFINLVEELVQPDEVRAFHVPMGLLHLRLQINRIRQPLVHQLAQGRPALVRDVVFCFVQCVCLFNFVVDLFI